MLQKQNISVSFGQGVDTKTDEKLVMTGKLTVLENGIFTSGKTIKKRNGYDALETNISGGGAIGSSQGLVAYDNELLLFSDEKLYSFSENSEAWVQKGSAFSVNVGGRNVIRNSYTQSAPNFALNGNVAVYAWNDSSDGIKALVRDLSTDVDLISEVSLNAIGTMPKVIACGGFIFIYYKSGTSIYARKYDPVNGSSFGVETLLFGDSFATGLMDVCLSGSKMVLTYKKTDGNIVVSYITQNLAIGTALLGLPSPVTITTTIANCISVSTDLLQNVYVSWHDGSSAVKMAGLRSDFTTLFAAANIDTGLATVNRITSIFDGTDTVVFYEVNAAIASNVYLKKATATVAGPGSGSVLKRSVGLATKAFLVNGVVYIGAVHDSTLQSTIFWLKASGDIVAKSQPSVSGGLPVNCSLANVEVIGNSIKTVTQIKTKFVSENGTTFTQKGIFMPELDFLADQNFYSRKLGENLHISGGFLSMYDGATVVEHGFHLYPENYSITHTTGGSLSNGTYLYYTVYAWIDNKGQMHRSSPGVGLTFTAATNDKPTIAIPTLRITSKVAPRANVFIEVYRTIANGTIPYKLTTVAAPLYNDVTVDSVTYLDNNADSAIQANEVLYTTGGILDNIAPPSCQIIELYKNRLAVSGLENKLEVWYSKSKSSANGVGFSDSFVFRCNPMGGDIKALKFMDDKLIIFKETLMFVISGDGPNDAGQQNTITNPELITSDVGCPYPNSIVLVPSGIMFKSKKGIYLLTRQLQVQYVGADVEAYNKYQVQSADLLQDKNQVRFLTKDGPCLMFDYYFGQWSIFTNHKGIDADVWKDSYIYLRTNGEVYQENKSIFKDHNTEFRLKIATAWLKFAGVQGFQRVKKAAVLGNYKSSHILKMSIGYDYEKAYVDQVLFNAGAVVSNEYYGDDVIYGESTPYGGGNDNIYQFRVHMPRQKCQAVRFLFEDITAGNAGEAYSLSDLSLEIAVKRGLNKLKLSKTLG